MSDNIAIDDAVDMELLKKIHAQYLRLSEHSSVPLQAFGEPNLTDRESLVAYQQYLRGLTWSLRNIVDCKQCPGGGCPPCFGWTRSDYQDYLQKLSDKSAGSPIDMG